MVAKKPLHFHGRPKPSPDQARKLAELEAVAEARANAVAGETVSKPTSSQPRKPATPQARNTARSGTRDQPYVRSDGEATRSTTVHLPVDLLRRLRRDAAEREVHMSAIIADALRRWYG